MFKVDEPRKWGHSAPEAPEAGHYVIIWAYTMDTVEADKLAQITVIRDNWVATIPIYPNHENRTIRVKVDDLAYLGMNQGNRTHTWAYTPE